MRALLSRLRRRGLRRDDALPVCALMGLLAHAGFLLAMWCAMAGAAE